MNDNGYRSTKKTIKPLSLMKFGHKEATALTKRLNKANKSVAAAAATSGKDVDKTLATKPKRPLSSATQRKINEFCELVQAVDAERSRLTEYVTALNLCGSGVALNAWSLSQLAPSNIIRPVATTTSTATGVLKRRNNKKKQAAVAATAVSENFWIMTVRIADTANGVFTKRQPDTVTMTIPQTTVGDQEDHSSRSLLAEYMVYKLWMIVRYVFNSVVSSVGRGRRTLVPLFVAVIDSRSPCGRLIKSLLSTSRQREVVELKTVYKCSFVFR